MSSSYDIYTLTNSYITDGRVFGVDNPFLDSSSRSIFVSERALILHVRYLAVLAKACARTGIVSITWYDVSCHTCLMHKAIGLMVSCREPGNTYISSALLKDPHKPHSVTDDVESTFWLLLDCARRYFGATGASSYIFDEIYVEPDEDGRAHHHGSTRFYSTTSMRRSDTTTSSSLIFYALLARFWATSTGFELPRPDPRPLTRMHSRTPRKCAVLARFSATPDPTL